MTARSVIGVDIGGTKIAVARFSEVIEGEVLTAPTPRGPEAIIATVIELSRAASGSRPITGIGVGSAGTFDPSGTVIHATALIPGWTGTRVAAELTAAFDVPAVALNDVHAAALAESQRGAGAGFSRVLTTTVGTGVGGAFVHDGVVDVGRTGSAGSVGHISVTGIDRVCSCGAVGHVEAVASGPGMERTFVELGGAPVGLREIGERAKAGDEVARAAIDAGGAALGRGLAAAAALYDPDVIVIGGGAAELGKLLFDTTNSVYRAESLQLMRDVEIRPAMLGVTATLVGAALAIQRLSE